MSAGISRNDPCPCGSKKKYKNCCGRKGFRVDLKLFKRIIIVVVVIAAAAWAGKKYVFVPEDVEPLINPLSNQEKRVQPLTPQPPGPPPPGKIWSPEHGHWHNTATGTAAGDSAFYPKPVGLPPPGKVWSYEHGHWHDSSYTGTENFKPGPPPPGLPPPGKVWSYEHGHWHDSSYTGAENFKPGPPPPGSPPPGKVWSYEHGHWHDEPGSQTQNIKSITPKKIQVGKGNAGDIKVIEDGGP